MRSKVFDNYIDFLKFAKDRQKDITKPTIVDNRLLSFHTKSYICKCNYDHGNLSPNKFVEELGLSGYSRFVHYKIDKLKDFAEPNTVTKWYGGYFGGLIGVNNKIINNYVGNGEVFDFFDYDINSAYLKVFSGYLPTKFVKTMTIEEYNQLNELDKMPYIYFFDISLKSYKTYIQKFKLIGDIKGVYNCFDFLNSKNISDIIVSEARLNLINQVYFSNYNINKVYVFEQHKSRFFETILQRYMDLKSTRDKNFKKNALKLYGSFGKIYNKKDKDIFFENGILKSTQEVTVNYSSSPQIAMYIADTVALRLFEIISANLDKIIAWNTDGFTAVAPVKVRIGKQPGYFKMKKIKGCAFLTSQDGARIFIKDILDNKIYLSDSIIEKNNKFYQQTSFRYSSIKKGYTEATTRIEIKKTYKYDYSKSYRAIAKQEIFKREVLREYEKF